MGETFVLVHGTWHGGWAWVAVIRELSRKGHRAHAPTLAGHGPGAMRKGITHQDCVASVVAYMDQRGLEDVILVGHSFGGTVVQKLAEQLPNQIRRTVFLDALVLKDNERVFDILPDVFLDTLTPRDGNGPVATSPDDTMQIPPWETWLKRFYSLALPSSFIYCRHDRAMPSGYFHPGMSSRLGAFKLLEMDGSHEVMFTRPAELAAKILEACRE